MTEKNTKHEHMKLKSEECRRLFGLPETETVIQDYSCMAKGSIVGGRIYICQNYVNFLQKLPYKIEKIPFKKVIDIKETTYLLQKYITIDMGSEKFMISSFWTFQHYHEAYRLIKHLWYNTPSYISIGIEDPVIIEQKEPESNEVVKVFGCSWEDEPSRLSNRISIRYQTPLSLDPQDEYPPMDKDNEKQGRIVDRDLEKLPMFVGNSYPMEKQVKFAQNPKARMLAIQQGKEPIVNIEILCKLPNDNLAEAVLILDEEKWSCVNPNTGNLIKQEYIYKYTDIDKIVLRSRPEHCDIRFKQSVGKDRFRFMSSFLQIITNEIILRSKSNEKPIQVIFEPGSKQFEYNNPKISLTSPQDRKNPGTRRAASKKPQKNNTEKALDDVDADLDEISGLLVNLGSIETPTT